MTESKAQDTLEDLGQRVREAREKAGMTRVELAEKAAVSVPTLERIENGRTAPLLGTVAAIAAALGADFHEIAFGASREDA